MSRSSPWQSSRQEAGECGSCPPSPCLVCQLGPAGDRDRRQGEEDEEEEYDDTEYDDTDTGDQDQDDVNIDDGLLDDAFDDAGVEVEPRNNNNNNQCSSCDMAVCVMGGGNSQVQRTGLSCFTECFTILLCQGAVSDVASVTPDGDRRRARGLYIAPFPSFMTRAGGQVRSRDMW